MADMRQGPSLFSTAILIGETSNTIIKNPASNTNKNKNKYRVIGKREDAASQAVGCAEKSVLSHH